MLEDTLAVGEFALAVIEDAKAIAIIEADLIDALHDGMPVRAGIAVDRCSDGARNAGHGLDSLQPLNNRVVHQVLQFRARRYLDAGSGAPDSGGGKAQNNALEP